MSVVHPITHSRRDVVTVFHRVLLLPSVIKVFVHAHGAWFITPVSIGWDYDVIWPTVPNKYGFILLNRLNLRVIISTTWAGQSLVPMFRTC